MAQGAYIGIFYLCSEVVVVRSLFIWSLVIAVAACSFFLFEPVFRWNMGWQNLPSRDITTGTSQAHSDRYAKALTAADQHINGIYLSGDYPGLSIAIGHQQELIWTKTIGFRNIAEGQPLRPDTPMRIGSTAKPITATLAAILVDREQLGLDQSIDGYIDYLSPELGAITMRQLLSHTAGIRNYGVCVCFPIWEIHSKKAYATVKQSIEHFSGAPLLFAPGSEFSYSSYGYVLASGALEGVGDTQFGSLLLRHVFIPLGMKDTSLDLINHPSSPADIIAATPYEVEGGRYKTAFPVSNSNKYAGGGMLSTAQDLVRLGFAWTGGARISEETRQIFLQPQMLSDSTDNPQFYALGWRNAISEKMFGGKKPVRIIHHGGTGAGGTAFLVIFPDYDLVIAIITNRSMDSSGALFDVVIPIAENLIEELETGN